MLIFGGSFDEYLIILYYGSNIYKYNYLLKIVYANMGVKRSVWTLNPIPDLACGYKKRVKWLKG